MGGAIAVSREIFVIIIVVVHIYPSHLGDDSIPPHTNVLIVVHAVHPD